MVVDPLMVLLVLYSIISALVAVSTFRDTVEVTGDVRLTDLLWCIREVLSVLLSFIWYYFVIYALVAEREQLSEIFATVLYCCGVEETLMVFIIQAVAMAVIATTILFLYASGRVNLAFGLALLSAVLFFDLLLQQWNLVLLLLGLGVAITVVAWVIYRSEVRTFP